MLITITLILPPLFCHTWKVSVLYCSSADTFGLFLPSKKKNTKQKLNALDQPQNSGDFADLYRINRGAQNPAVNFKCLVVSCRTRSCGFAADNTQGKQLIIRVQRSCRMRRNGSKRKVKSAFKIKIFGHKTCSKCPNLTQTAAKSRIKMTKANSHGDK